VQLEVRVEREQQNEALTDRACRAENACRLGSVLFYCATKTLRTALLLGEVAGL
jgi:hypothetical protein